MKKRYIAEGTLFRTMKDVLNYASATGKSIKLIRTLRLAGWHIYVLSLI